MKPQEDGRPDAELLSALVGKLSGRLPLVGPIFLTLSIALSILFSVLPVNQGLAGALTLYLAMAGGFVEFYFLLALTRARSIAAGEKWGDARMIIRSAWLIPVYFTILGTLLLAKHVREDLEYIVGKPVESTPCSRFYSGLLVLATLGAYAAVFQACVARVVAERLNVLLHEAPEGLSSEADDREEDSGRPDAPV